VKRYAIAAVIALAVIALVASLAWALQTERAAAAAGNDSAQMQMGSMSGQMCGMTDAAAISISNDEIYVVKGDTLYRFSRDLKLVKQVSLGSGADQGSPRAASGGGCPMMSGGSPSSPAPSPNVPGTSGHHH